MTLTLPRRARAPRRLPSLLLGSAALCLALAALPADRLGAARGAAPVAGLLARTPLLFTENRGQLPPAVSYSVHGGDKTLYFTPQGVVCSLIAPTASQPGRDAWKEPQAERLASTSGASAPPGSVRRWTVRMEFTGSRPVAPTGEDRARCVTSYFQGSNPQRLAGIPNFSALRYRELWPGVDLVYRGAPGMVKYEFQVSPGADPARIGLRYRGADRVRINERGELVAETPLGSLTDHAPFAYQEVEGKRVEVPASYSLAAREGADPEVSFRLGHYDRSRPLIIDPALLMWCGYLGGVRSDAITDVAVDAAGDVYVTGWTQSREDSFPVRVGPDLTSEGTGPDTTRGFVAKVRADGTELLYCGFIGGDPYTMPNAIAVDTQGRAYVCGYTASSEDQGFPAVVGPDRTYAGEGDAFIARVAADGAALDYCGYVGGDGYENAMDVVVDLNGAAYLTGGTTSRQGSFPVRIGPDVTYNARGRSEWNWAGDAFVAKVHADGSALTYCGYIGGAHRDWANSIAVDPHHNVYVAGYTTSTERSFPVRGGPDRSFNGNGDGWVAQVRPDASGLVFCGYVGGNRSDSVSAVAVDGNGEIYLSGYTESGHTSFPVRIGPDLTYTGSWEYDGGDGWVAKLRAGGRSLVYCGYLGGDDDDRAAAIAVDEQGRAYVAGTTGSPQDTFLTSGGPDLVYNGGRSDAFVVRVAADGRRLEFSGYVGGRDRDVGSALALGPGGSLCIGGLTASDQTTFPARVGPELVYKNNTTPQYVRLPDGFIARLVVDDANPLPDGRIRVEPRAWAAEAAVGGSAERVVQVRNTGSGPLRVNVPPLVAPFTVSGVGDHLLPPGEGITLTVTFAPTSPGTSLSGLVITSSDPGQPLVQIPLAGSTPSATRLPSTRVER